MHLDIPLELYKIFCSVVRTGNMSAAAKELYISQPAVSMSIRQLESKLGSPLLIRTSKGAVPTAEGKMLYGYLEEALSLINVAEKNYIDMVKLESGELRIGAGDSLIKYFLLPYLEHFTYENKNINIKVSNKTTYETLKLLKLGRIDIGFINLPIENDGSFETKNCKEIRDILVCGSKFKHLSESGISVSQLSDYPLLMLEKLSNSRRYIDSFLLQNGISANPVIELGSMDLLIQFARINLGLAFVTREFAEKEIDNQSLFEVPITPSIPFRHIGLVKLKNVKLSNAAGNFAAMI